MTRLLDPQATQQIIDPRLDEGPSKRGAIVVEPGPAVSRRQSGVQKGQVLLACRVLGDDQAGIRVLVLAISVCLIGLTASTAMAKPRSGSGIDICMDPKVLNSPGGSQCVAEGDQDTLDGHAYRHTVVCDPGLGNMCCLSDGTRFFSCTSIRIRTGRPGGIFVPPHAGLAPPSAYTPPSRQRPPIRPPSGSVKNPGVPPRGHPRPTRFGGFGPPAGVKTTGTNSEPGTIERTGSHSGGHR